MTRDQRTLLFLHLGKTGGSTLHRIAERQYPQDRIFSLKGRETHAALERLIDLPEEEKSRLLLVSGHIHYGVHEHMPQECVYITVVRDPVERIISHYYYVLSKPDHHLYATVKRRKLSLREYVESGISVELDNGQTRLLAGADGRTIPFGECEPELLERACAHLKKFAVVGLTERFDETVLLLQRELGWKLPLFIQRNVTHSRPRATEIDDGTLQAIRERNELDMAMYEYVCTEFASRIVAEGVPFGRRLRLFRFGNLAYGRMQSFRHRFAY